MSRAARIAIVGAGVLATAEIALRIVGFGDPPVAILDDAVEYYPQPNGTFRRFGNDISINRWGMRSADFDRTAAQGRVFLLGDSVVYGNHFLDQRETIAAQLSARLTAQRAEATPVAAIAASSWGPGNLLAYWQRFGPFRGEVAVVVQSAHDRADVPFTSTDIIPYRKRASLCALDDAFQVIVERAARVLRAGDTPRQLSFEERLAMSESALRALLEALRPNFRRLVLLYHPTLKELHGQQPGQAGFFRGLAGELDVEWATAFAPGLEGAALERLFDDDIHPSAAGARFVAAYLATAIELEASQRQGGVPDGD